MIDFSSEEFSERLRKTIKTAGGNKDVASVCGVSNDYLIEGKDVTFRIDSQITEQVIKETGRIASLIAEASNKKGKFDYDPADFGDTFVRLLEHSLAEVATSEEKGTIIDFQMKKSNR